MGCYTQNVLYNRTIQFSYKGAECPLNFFGSTQGDNYEWNQSKL